MISRRGRTSAPRTQPPILASARCCRPSARPRPLPMPARSGADVRAGRRCVRLQAGLWSRTAPSLPRPPRRPAPRDAQDLMAYPFFSLAKSKRLAPIDFRAGAITIRVEAVPEHGMATIWDADVLIWAASQIVNARDAGLRTSRLMAASPYEILTFVGRARAPGTISASRQASTGSTRQPSRPPSAKRLSVAGIAFLDQRMEGESRRQRPGAGRRAHPARLVLRRRPRRRARLDHRSRVFLADRRARALALPGRSQARRPAERLEFDFLSACEVRQPLAAQALRL